MWGQALRHRFENVRQDFSEILVQPHDVVVAVLRAPERRARGLGVLEERDIVDLDPVGTVCQAEPMERGVARFGARGRICSRGVRLKLKSIGSGAGMG